MADKIFNFLINYFSNMNDRGVDEMNNFRGNISSDEVVEWLKKVQNIHVEQPSEELEKVATALTNVVVGELNVSDYTDHSGHNAHWHSFREGVVAGANWQKQRTINKACEWLKENIYNRIYKCNDGLGFPTATFLAEFKKAMEDK